MSTDTQTQNDSTAYPDRGVEWGEPTELDGITFVPITTRATFNGDVHSLGTNEAAYILDGHEDYLSERDTTEIEVPKYYSRFDGFTNVPLQVTATTGSNYTAWGITKYRLEKAVRFATGGGRYSSNDLTVIGTDAPNFVVEYDGEVFLFSPTQLRSLPEGYEPETYPVRGFDVSEDNPNIRNALGRVLDTVERFDVTVTEYDELHSGSHVFTQSDGQRLKIRGHDLQKLAASPTDPEEMEREWTIETNYDEEFTVNWEAVEYGIGDEYDDWYHDDPGIVMGYKVQWEDPRTSSRVSMTGKITVDATYLVLRFVDNRSKKYDYDEVKVKRESERLGEFDPENKEWNPLSPPNK